MMVKTWVGRVIAPVMGLVLAQAAMAQTGADLQALGKEIEALKAGQTAIQKELQEIKGLLQGQAAQPTITRTQAAARTPPAPEVVDVVLSVADAPVKGEANAKVTVVEFTDYQCPFCARHFRQTWPQLEQDYVRTGKAKFVLRELPLEQIHPQAFKAAEAAQCAGEQGKYWEMHDRLFANQDTLGRKELSGHAQAVGLDVGAFDQCVDSAKTAMRIRKDILDSEKLGARGTPVFYVGLTEPNSAEFKAVRVIRGAQPYAAFKDAIDTLLAAAK